MNIFNLIATLTLDDKQYKSGINDAKKSNSSFGNSSQKTSKMSAKGWLAIASAVAVAVGVIVKAIKETISYGDAIGKQSQKLNMTTDAYQKWALAMKMAGTDISTMSMGMKTLTDIINTANEGSADSIILFDKLGLKFEDLKDMTPEDQLYEVVNAFQGMEQGASKTQLAIDFFGRSGQELLPLLNQEQGSINDLFSEFENLGLIIDEGAVKQSEELDDRITLLTESFNIFKNKALMQLYPYIEKLLAYIEDFKNSELYAKIQDISKLIKDIGVLLKPFFESLQQWNSDELTYTVDLIKSLLTMFKAILELDFETFWNSFLDVMKVSINFAIDKINTLIEGLNKISFNLPDWMGGQKFGINIPLIPRLKKGMDFIPNDMYMANLDYGERVLTRSENEKYTALGGVEGIEALVNGINLPQNNTSNNININVKIGDKEIKDFIFETVNNQLNQKGYKDLNKLGGYNK